MKYSLFTYGLISLIILLCPGVRIYSPGAAVTEPYPGAGVLKESLTDIDLDWKDVLYYQGYLIAFPRKAKTFFVAEGNPKGGNVSESE